MSKITQWQFDGNNVRFLTDESGELWINYIDFMEVNSQFATKH